ncbi:MAG: 23S rRNA (guanosine(2251)-2'-O)-methyltransferase RlmB [Desulfobacterales bacterium]|nr:23S rRNA (guanosine(2251)-2'-O)-methyltransferase RlmB [Desulfobacterales bacterium]MCP4164049.1 23S rRNA (guanosine(2251)-2'-O)-methyltransferase RlmB [Deltaproteobacteria bacterium]
MQKKNRSKGGAKKKARKQTSQRPEQKGYEILFGINSVYEALKADRRKFFEIYFSKDPNSKRLQKITEFTKQRDIKVVNETPDKLSILSGSDYHQGVCAKVSDYPVVDMGAFINIENPFLLLVENVVDPSNLGALIRTAHCAGVDGVITLKDRAVSHTPSVSRASAGALEHVKFAKVTNMVNCINELKEKGIWVTGLDAKAETSLYDANLKGPLAIVVGGEDKGVRPLVQKNCDFLISIPQHGSFNSLNASVAGAIVIYESLRQRQK